MVYTVHLLQSRILIFKFKYKDKSSSSHSLIGIYVFGNCLMIIQDGHLIQEIQSLDHFLLREDEC